SNLASVSLATLNTPALTDSTIQADVALGGNGTSAGLVARYSGANQANFYLGMIYNNNGVYQAYIFLNQAGTFKQLAEQDLPGFSGSGTLSFSVTGTSLKLYVNNILQASATDSILTAGLIGIRSAGSSLDNFGLS